MYKHHIQSIAVAQLLSFNLLTNWCQIKNELMSCIRAQKFQSSITERIGFFFFSFLTDLKTMSERLKSRYYTTRKLFMADMQRIFTNCREYNPPESEYYKCANLLEKFFYTKIKEAGLIEK